MTWNKLLSREGVDITTLSGIDVVFYDAVSQFSKRKEELFFTHFKDRTFTHYIDVDPKEVGRFLLKKYFNSSKEIEKYYNEGCKFLKDIENRTNTWKKKLKKSGPNRAFTDAFAEFRKDFMKISYIYSILSWPAIESWQADFELMLSNLIKKNSLESKQDEILASVYRPWKDSAVHEIQKRITSGENIQKLVKEYQFLRSWSVVWYSPLDEALFKNIGKSGIYHKKTLSEKELLAILHPNAEEKRNIELAPYIIFFKDWRDDARRKQAYLWSFFFDLIAQRYDVDMDDIGYLSLDELEKCLKLNKIDSSTIKRRKNNAIIVTADVAKLKIKVLDDVPDKYKQIIDDIDEQEKHMTIKGLIAQKGKVTGKVKIVRSQDDIKDVNEGDIMVSNTTHPNYLPAMQKASAFITNEGGVISHAAIVAREMKKPCIVGTKVATKVLKDGDLVEVDANTGTVKLIKKSLEIIR